MHAGCLELGQGGWAPSPRHHGCLSPGPGKELWGDSLDLSDSEALSELPRSPEVGGKSVKDPDTCQRSLERGFLITSIFLPSCICFIRRIWGERHR